MKFIIFSIIISLCSTSISYTLTTAPVHYLDQGDTRKLDKYYTNQLNIFCYKGKPKYIIHVWQSVLMKINHPTNEYTRYDSPSPELVEKLYMKKQYSWSLNLFAKDNNIKLDPFNDSCVGIETKYPYSVTLSIIKIDLWKLIYLVSGAILFLSARKLSKNTVFYYASGVAAGICASFIVLIYFFSKLFPKKPYLFYGILGCGWTVVLYVLQVLWENIQTILELYKIYVLWYILITGIISFIAIYRWGPAENERTKNLMRWALQIMGLTLIYFSSHFQEAAIAQGIFIVIFYNMPQGIISLPKKYWRRKFPPKVKLISNDEYYEQGVKETKRALEDLRKFCSSPDCNQWKMALKLQNVKSNSHLSDDEMLDYETSIQETYHTDDESENEYTDDES